MPAMRGLAPRRGLAQSVRAIDGANTASRFRSRRVGTAKEPERFGLDGLGRQWSQSDSVWTVWASNEVGAIQFGRFRTAMKPERFGLEGLLQ